MTACANHLPHRVVERHNGNSGTITTGRFEDTVNEFRCCQRTHAVVNGNHVNIADVTDADESVFHAVPACLATSHHTMRHLKAILSAQLPPQFHMFLRQGHNYIKRTVPIFSKGFDGAHQNRDATQFQELLGQLRPKARATASSHYNRYRSHLIFYF